MFDALVILWVWVELFENYNADIEIAFTVLVILPTLILSIMIFVKIQKMKAVTKGNLYEKNIMKDLHRAAIVCCCQPLCFTIYLVMIIFGEWVHVRTGYDDSPLLLFQFYIFISPNYSIVMMLCILFDSLLIMLVLKTYRSSLRYIARKVCPCQVKISSSDAAFIMTAS